MKTDEQMAMEYANRATGRYTPGSAIDEAYITGSRDGAARQREQDACIAEVHALENGPDDKTMGGHRIAEKIRESANVDNKQEKLK